MGDPTSAQVETFTTIGDIATFVEITGTDADRTTVLGSLLTHMGYQAKDRPATLGVITEADADAALGRWQIAVALDSNSGAVTSRRAPSLGELGKAKLMARICRLMIGGNTGHSPGTPHPTAASSVAARKVKLSQILSQIDDTEVEVLDEKMLLVMYARYEQLYGKGQRPHPSREPSVEQLTAIHGLITSGQNPYVDFAIFGPYATRLKKKLKFQGLTLSKEGELVQTELYGPHNFGTWKASFEVYSNTLIMTDTVDLGAKLAYQNRVERLFERYGEKSWGLLYQADVRARLEEIPRIKLELSEKPC